jgi:spore coat protein U-like protein
MKKTALVIVVMTIVALAGVAMALDSNTLTVTASVVGTCKFNSATSTLAFGSLDPSAASDANLSTSVQFWCTKGTIETLTPGQGNNWSGTSRQIKDAVSGDVIPYGLILTPDGSANAGPASPRTLTIAGSILGTDYTTVSAGDYADTVTITINP